MTPLDPSDYVTGRKKKVILVIPDPPIPRLIYVNNSYLGYDNSIKI